MGVGGFPILKRKLGGRLRDRVIKQIIILIMAIFMPFSVSANITCQGRFVNPITDIGAVKLRET
jgi:conjugal transfer pilus assembly protein TraU